MTLSILRNTQSTAATTSSTCIESVSASLRFVYICASFLYGHRPPASQCPGAGSDSPARCPQSPLILGTPGRSFDVRLELFVFDCATCAAAWKFSDDAVGRPSRTLARGKFNISNSRCEISYFALWSCTGNVGLSNIKKFFLSARKTPFSVRPLHNRSRTFFSWYPVFAKFHVSPL
ncbi:hypothetical protein AYI70_g2524 [Smittium culicis]|uniref:Uncharacterized protein n=1 Tax=Smittium culicis TaxID=133412 RepID=A0A1R1Y815_9FUNG|nr:hypothetical protein AYI70_g2524 [Smittium culicis]